MQYFVGIDAGSCACKIVIINAMKQIVASGVVAQGTVQNKVAETLLEALLGEYQISKSSIVSCVSTGYARKLIKFSNYQVTEITCHAKGVHHLAPETQLIIELGGQDAKAIALHADGRVKDFVMNDRCAAGTGRFLEMVGVRLGVDLEAFGELLATSNDSTLLPMSSMCVVFAETEIIGMLANGVSPSHILRAVQHAIASRVVSMMGNMVQKSITFTGGVALVSGMHEALENVLKLSLNRIENPQLTGALGASLIAYEKFKSQTGA